MRTRVLCVSILLGLSLVGCKTRNSSSATKDGLQASSEATGEKNYYDEGFTLKVETKDSDNDGATDRLIVLNDGAGAEIGQHEVPDTGLALDRGYTPEGDVVFTWPRSTEVINRDYDRLGELMMEYSTLAGTVLHRAGVGPGEQKWLEWIRSDQGQRISSMRTVGVKPFCNEVIGQLVNRLVPRGSQFRQYGNCGEGGLIGSCLATRAGFRENEIRVCLSANDHFFAMVYRGMEDGVDKKWCIMDRWDLIGNFSCGVDIDNVRHQVTKDGELTGQNWFQRAACTTLDKYRANASANLYQPVSSL